MTLYIALCDDERETLENEKRLIQNIFKEKGVVFELATYCSPIELLKSKTVYDLVFLDIEMSEMNGIDLAKQMMERNKKCMLFFLTNYSVYLDKAFDVNATRFLTKPVDPQRLSEGIERALERIDNASKTILVTNCANKIPIQIPTATIIYIENVGRHTRIVSTEQEFIAEEVFTTLKNRIEKEVKYFAAPHQSYFVNLRYVTKHDKMNVEMTYAGKTYKADMSRRQYNEFDKKMFLTAKDL